MKVGAHRSSRGSASAIRVVMSCTGRPVAHGRRRRRAAMLCLRTIAAISGFAMRQPQRRGDGRRPRRGRRRSLAVSGEGGRRANRGRRSPSRPGVSSAAPAAARCAGVSDGASAVTTPTRRPGGSAASSPATRSRLRGLDGAQAAPPCISFWNSARKPQSRRDGGAAFGLERPRRGDERREERPVRRRSPPG